MAKGKKTLSKVRGERSGSRLRKVSVESKPAFKASTKFPGDYGNLLEGLKSRIRIAQLKAVLNVNSELIQLYWDIGGLIVKRQEAEGWGTKVIDRLADDLQREFAAISGFSRTNIYRMRSFFNAYSNENLIVPEAVGQLPSSIVPQPMGQLPSSIVAKPVRQIEVAVLPPFLAQIPWGHNIILFEKLKDPVQRRWYAGQVPVQGWSQAVLVHQIESDLYHRSGKAVTNFSKTLPSHDSDLAQQLFKDPYNFDFLTLAADVKERDLEISLIEHLKTFLLELGVGFAFVGQQFHIEVAGKDFSLDLLFYHLHLHRYIVIDLKVEEFKPEFAGKMNFYFSAVDDQFRHGDDQTSIGLILCKTQDRLIAEYALRDTSKPMGVATYTAKLPQSLRASLPSPDELIRELNRQNVKTKTRNKKQTTSD
jgi:predicted nuclease of restriction endonuclease-like (RecB) superfamily